MSKKTFGTAIVFLIIQSFIGGVVAQTRVSQDGSELWFTNMEFSKSIEATPPSSICIWESSDTFEIIKEELCEGVKKLFNQSANVTSCVVPGSILIGTSVQQEIAKYIKDDEIKKTGDDGFIIRTVKSADITIITGNTDKAVLYGVYHYLRILQTGKDKEIDVVEIPDYQRRILNHWDNLDGSVERGYAGKSIWKWDELPEKISTGYVEYARANASIGINGTVLNNVNANPEILSKKYLEKVKIIANQLRPYGIKTYLSINFSSPAELGGLLTSDPLDEEVQKWWQEKVKEIYSLIPDFGGFLVKANSEGLPGPQDFGRTHADGANMLADALKPFNGIVMWRAFVYNPEGGDRAKQAYDEFMPLDGQFRKNVIIQVKNGPVDFQPREPFSPLFGNMKKTSLMPELQITQEYLGFSDHLVYLGPLFKEFLNADTYTQGKNTTISRITNGSVFNDSITAIAGVANIGTDANWCGHHFAQANWYAFGRLAWNHQLTAKDIANEWLKQTFTQDEIFVSSVSELMMESREAVVNYMTPLGLHHLMGWSHHYGPEPWCDIPGARPDWLPAYYHRADSFGIGFDRSSTGSNAVSQYAEPLRSLFDDPALCPKEYLLWFHHLPWDYELINGRDLWTEMCYRYSYGVEQVELFQKLWDKMEGEIDLARFNDVKNKLSIQFTEATWWRDACLLYFQTFSGRDIPLWLKRPVYQLEELKKRKFDMEPHS